MNTLKRYNQLKDMEACQQERDDILRRATTPWPAGPEGVPAVPEWAPLVDICEDSNEYLIKAELPEVNKEDVKVIAEEGMLTIMGERKFLTEENGKRYHRVERAYGTFGRTFALPDDVRPGKVRAEFKEGVLTVHLVKEPKAKTEQFEVNIS